MIVSGLNIHPVKSTAIRPVQHARVEPWGLAGDRRWMVMDADHVLVSARTDQRLFTITADTPATADVTDDLVLTHPDLPELRLATPVGELVAVRVHKNDLQAVPVGAEADSWVRTAIGRDDVRLMWCDDPTRRRLNPQFSRPTDSTGFADGYPLLLTTTTSLRRLNDWIVETALEHGETAPEPLPMQRFRPNVVIEGVEEAFAEDRWKRIRIGDVEFRAAKPCARCVMTTVNPQDLSTGKEPIRTLARYRRWDGQTWFGTNLIPAGQGMVRVGDPVTVLG